MKGLMILANILIKLWAKSKCPFSYSLGYRCTMCKYNDICTKFAELGKALDRYE